MLPGCPDLRYAKAEAKFKEALEEAIKGFDAKDPHIASAKNNLAEFYRNTKQYVKAEPLYIEVREGGMRGGVGMEGAVGGRWGIVGWTWAGGEVYQPRATWLSPAGTPSSMSRQNRFTKR